MARRYLVADLPETGAAQLPGDVSHHLANVLRVRRGERIVLFDGKGRECQAEVTEVRTASTRAGGGRAAEVLVVAGAARASAREPAVRCELAFALPKGARAEWLFEHGTEAGVAVFRPLVLERSSSPAAGRAERWRRIVAAAAGQCDRALVPEVKAAATLEALLSDPQLPAERWYGSAEGAPLPPGAGPSVLIVVGPEGGLTPGERSRLEAAGVRPARFGALTLRTETAALLGAALALRGC